MKTEMTEKMKSVNAIHRQLKKCRELSSDECAKMPDEEVAKNASRLVWRTAHLAPQEQSVKIVAAGHCFHWRVVPDNWPIADVANRLMHDEEAAKRLVCEGLPADKNADADYLAESIRHAKFIHFQMTRASNGGLDAYVAFRIPDTARAIVVRFCR